MHINTISDLSNATILVTNDDGIHAPGLEVLEAIARELSSDVWVVAPETEQSGAGHSLSLHQPLRYQQYSPRRFAVRGTPTDCVLMASTKLVSKKIDLVLSGINRGCNLAEDITHSGTVAAAMEGVLCGIPAIALSQMFDMDNPRATIPWDTPRAVAPELIRKIVAGGIPAGRLMNINFPDRSPEDCKGAKVTFTGRRKISKQLDERLDKKGRPYFWVHWGEDVEQQAQGSDLQAINDGYISVSPINVDLTDYEALTALQALES
jgi:5'-nucleotidase